MNDLSGPIRANQRLYLRAPERVMIRPGDTIESVSERFGVPVEWLQRFNGYDKGEAFTPGRMMSLWEAADLVEAPAEGGEHPLKDYVDSVMDSQKTM
jgi:hypothetical protein